MHGATGFSGSGRHSGGGGRQSHTSHHHRPSTALHATATGRQTLTATAAATAAGRPATASLSASLGGSQTRALTISAHVGQFDPNPLDTGYCVPRELSSTRVGSAWPASASATTRAPPGAPPASTVSLVRATAARAWAADRTHWLNASAVLESERRVAGAVLAASGYVPSPVAQPFRSRAVAEEARPPPGWQRPPEAALLAAEAAKFHVVPAAARAAHTRTVTRAMEASSRASFGWA